VTRQQDLLNDVLEQVARELDIPPHKYKEAMERFDAIKRHLEDGNYPGSTPPPSIYPQGSFRYGTVTRPVKEGKDADFDLDIVCEVDRAKEDDHPATLKKDVGLEVIAYARKNGMGRPANKSRCWTLEYAPDNDGVGFHVDILPCLPDGDAGLAISEANLHRGATASQYTSTTIAITDRNDDVMPPKHSWRSSNPRGYAKWFHDICQAGYDPINARRQKVMMFEAYRDRPGFYPRAEDIPDQLLRTPLQRAIQLMKRHRDVCFSGRSDGKDKPISMIITTLATRLYEGRASELTTTRSALRHIVNLLADHAALASDQLTARALRHDVAQLRLIQRVGDRWYIPNPINPHYPGDPADKGGNFADRWHEDNHAKAKAFFRWVAWLRADLDALLNANGISGMGETLKAAFGDTVAENATRRLGISSPPQSRGNLVAAASSVAGRFDVPHRQRPPWPARFGHNVTIDSTATRNGFRTLRSSRGFNHIPEHYALLFQAKTTIDWPFDVHWQVVNNGSEATAAKGLRGNIFSGSPCQRESTRYKGFHWIECFIVKDGILVARSGEFVVNIE